MVAQREPLRMTVEEWRELERNSHDINHPLKPQSNHPIKVVKSQACSSI